MPHIVTVGETLAFVDVEVSIAPDASGAGALEAALSAGIALLPHLVGPVGAGSQALVVVQEVSQVFAREADISLVDAGGAPIGASAGQIIQDGPSWAVRLAEPQILVCAKLTLNALPVAAPIAPVAARVAVLAHHSVQVRPIGAPACAVFPVKHKPIKAR